MYAQFVMLWYSLQNSTNSTECFSLGVKYPLISDNAQNGNFCNVRKNRFFCRKLNERDLFALYTLGWSVLWLVFEQLCFALPIRIYCISSRYVFRSSHRWYNFPMFTISIRTRQYDFNTT